MPREAFEVPDNPILDFGIDKGTLRYVGHDLQRPECILAEPDGTLWTADARGGVVRLCPDGSQEIVTQRRSGHFQTAGTDASRYLEGTLPNGLAFDRDGNFLISNFGTDCLELMLRDGTSRVWADGIAFDRAGNLWGTLVYSDKLFVITPQGDMRILLDEGDTEKVDALERAFLQNHVTEDVLFATGAGIAPWMASVTFGGPDLQTVYIGSLKGNRIPYFRAAVHGLPIVHWHDHP